MNLAFEEGECGDGICAMAENTGTCPNDCPLGAFNGYCNGMRVDVAIRTALRVQILIPG